MIVNMGMSMCVQYVPQNDRLRELADHDRVGPTFIKVMKALRRATCTACAVQLLLRCVQCSTVQCTLHVQTSTALEISLVS